MNVLHESHRWQPSRPARPWKWCERCGACEGGTRGGVPCQAGRRLFQLEEPTGVAVNAVGPCPTCGVGSLHRSKLVRPGRCGPLALRCTRCGTPTGARRGKT